MTSELVAGRRPHYHHTDLLSGRSKAGLPAATVSCFIARRECQPPPLMRARFRVELFWPAAISYTHLCVERRPLSGCG
jgi:hypothetical protein